MRSVWLLAALIGYGCDRPAQIPPDAPPQVEIEPVVATDTLLADDPPWLALLPIDSIRPFIDSLEAEREHAPESRQAELLFEVGKLKKHYLAPKGTPHGDYAARREDEFWYDEISGTYQYTGKHLKQLIERFPNHPLADDAAYQMTLLPQGGECEGFVTCYIAVVLHQVDEFLPAYPQSPYAPRALQRAIDAFETNLKEVDLSKETESFDPKELPKILELFDNMTVNLPAELRAKAAAVINGIKARMGGVP